MCDVLLNEVSSSPYGVGVFGWIEDEDEVGNENVMLL
jgi:hypothetical protein